MKLARRDIKSYREQQLQRQDSRCALCGDLIENDAVLDHDHKTGRVRQVLHRGCNAFLGKIENNLARNRISTLRLRAISHNLIPYILDTHTNLQHPTYKTIEERKMQYKKKGGGKKPPKKY